MSSTVEDRLRTAARDVNHAAESIPDRDSPKMQRSPVLAVAAGVLGVLVLAMPLFLTGGGNGAEGVAIAPPTSATEQLDPDVPAGPQEDGGPVLSEVRDYWSLQGTLESVGSEPGWLCPSRPNSGYTFPVEGSAVPPELLFDLPEQEPIGEMNRDSGPTCDQLPALTLLAFTEAPRLDTTAGVAFWPSLTRFEDECPPESCSVVGSPEEDGSDTTPLEELTINDRPALLFNHVGTYRLWWEDQAGVPLYSVASGVTREELLSLAEAATVDPFDHLVSIPETLPAGLEIVERAPGAGVWQESLSHEVKYRIEDEDIHVGLSRTGALGRLDTAYTRHASNVGFSDLVGVGDSTGVWIPEGGNFLFFMTDDGVLVSVEGAGSKEQAVEIAEGLVFGGNQTG